MAGGFGWAAAAEGLTQLNNTAIQGWQQRRNQERQNKANMQLAEYSYNKDLEMWNKANLYNSPQAQMERLKSAGLNPNLVYGSGSVAGQSAGQIPRYQTPQATYDVDPMIKAPTAMLGMFQDFALKQLQIDNLKKQNYAQDQTNVLKEIEAKAAQEWGMDIFRNKANMSYTAMDKAWQERRLKNYQADILMQERDQYHRKLALQLESTSLGNQQKQQDIIFNQFRNEWMKMGITTSDNIIVRMVARLFGNNVGEFFKNQ